MWQELAGRPLVIGTTRIGHTWRRSSEQEHRCQHCCGCRRHSHYHCSCHCCCHRCRGRGHKSDCCCHCFRLCHRPTCPTCPIRPPLAHTVRLPEARRSCTICSLVVSLFGHHSHAILSFFVHQSCNCSFTVRAPFQRSATLSAQRCVDLCCREALAVHTPQRTCDQRHPIVIHSLLIAGTVRAHITGQRRPVRTRSRRQAAGLGRHGQALLGAAGPGY